MLSALSQRARVVLLGVGGAVAAFFLFGGAQHRSATGDPIDAVPRDSFLVATVNLAELRRSPLYEVLLGKDSPARGPKADVPVFGARALGIGKLADACGFDPLSRVERLAVAVPEEGDKGELGVAARVTVTRAELSTCTENLAGRRGGKVATKEVGDFVVVEDSAGAEEAARPRLAYGHGGLLVVGRGAWFDAMLAAADGKKPGTRDAAAHVAMRSSLTSRDGWRSPTVLISALLPRSLRDRLKNEMGAELPGGDEHAEASSGGSHGVMAGVLGVSGVGLALRAGGSGGSIDAAVELVCDSEEGCAAVEKLILKKRLDWSKELMLRMVGLGPLLDSIEVRRDHARIRVTAGASADALASTIDRVLRLTARSSPRGETVPAPPASAPPPP
ncbi:MAG: hypothetical protein KF764_10005 [Labilithrix sp.]|nr:hypothetical protein [Labilithrix sp.]MBX3219844.1 hypothetical protein [Labilithrix sp.]